MTREKFPGTDIHIADLDEPARDNKDVEWRETGREKI